MKKFAVLLSLITMCLSVSDASGDNYYITSGSARARALAMGSAYSSISDNFSSGFYNPGAFKVNAAHGERSFRIFLNPVCPAVGLREYSKYDLDFDKDNELTSGEILRSLSTVVKGAVFSTPFLDIGVGLWEEVIPGDTLAVKNSRFFSSENMSQYAFHSAFGAIKIAETISLGFTGTLYNRRYNGTSSYKSGYTFGIILNPNPKMKVGIAYNYMPDGFTNARLGLESLENETITSGISLYPDQNTVVSIDLRNLTRENLTSSREIHTGIEKRIIDHVALRAGYYRKKATQDDVLSFGIGILPRKVNKNRFETSSRNDTITYTVILEEDGFKRRWHMLSLLLRY
ncbi:hypothetical protein ACFL47_06515 [Candidatus Latescibacterota bacterium]